MSNNTKTQNINENQEGLNKEFRPDCLGDIIGQDNVIEPLLRGIVYNKISKSIILQGDKGLGKTTTARACSKTLNCQNIDEIIKPLTDRIEANPDTYITLDELKEVVRPCGECVACKEFEKNSEFAGVIEFDAGSEGKVDEVRNLKENLAYCGNFKYKVALIDEAHNMSKEGNTALLKIVEEPPKHVLFMFATTHPDDILPTIKSRSISLKFNGVDDELIESRLRYICEKSNIKISDEALKAISSSTEGGVRDAISNLEHADLKCKGRTIEVSDLEDIIEIEPEYVNEILGLIFEGTIDALISALNKVFSNRKLAIKNSHLDYFITKIRAKMYEATSREERTLLREIYKIFVSEKERFMYNVTARTAIETAVLESFDLIEEYKMKKSTTLINTTREVPIDKGNGAAKVSNDSLLISKVEIFSDVFRLMFNEYACNLVIGNSDMIFDEDKNSLCFYVSTIEDMREVTKILKSENAQKIKKIGRFKGFIVKVKIPN